MEFLQELFKNQSYDPKNFFLIAGPCIVESEELVMEVAEDVYSICKKLGIPYVFKASYRKANRTSATSFTGIGDETAMEIVKKAGEHKVHRLFCAFKTHITTIESRVQFCRIQSRSGRCHR